MNKRQNNKFDKKAKLLVDVLSKVGSKSNDAIVAFRKMAKAINRVQVSLNLLKVSRL